MNVKALITGVEEVKFHSKKDGSAQSFFKINFIDTENPAGTPQSMSLSKDPEILATQVAKFETMRMKIIPFSVYQNGNYTNFGSFLS